MQSKKNWNADKRKWNKKMVESAPNKNMQLKIVMSGEIELAI